MYELPLESNPDYSPDERGRLTVLLRELENMPDDTTLVCCECSNDIIRLENPHFAILSCNCPKCIQCAMKGYDDG